jgi:uncharacterized protein YeaO (DUF488 family)
MLFVSDLHKDLAVLLFEETTHAGCLVRQRGVAMIKIKHLLDTVESGDGERMWVEPIGLTRDLTEWCSVTHTLTSLGPPMTLWRWFQDHPEGYDYFRGKYHEHLGQGRRRKVLMHLAAAALQEDFTLLHQGDDPNQNSATALYEYLTELQAYCKPE